MLPASQRVLLDQARTMRDDNIIEVSTIADAASAAAHGWAKIPWDRVGPDGEAELATHAVTVRCLQRANGSIPESDNEPGVVALVARAY
jgi:prolyl-tRNA synthetase